MFGMCVCLVYVVCVVGLICVALSAFLYVWHACMCGVYGMYGMCKCVCLRCVVIMAYVYVWYVW